MHSVSPVTNIDKVCKILRCKINYTTGRCYNNNNNDIKLLTLCRRRSM